MKAQTPYSIPVVDSLTIRVVVDSRYENILPKESHRFVNVDHVGDIPGKVIHTLAAEWGLSLHLTSETGGSRYEYLLDFGWTPEVINRNFNLLDIEPSKLNGLILSHGHLDHYGGLDGFLGKYRSDLPEDLCLYIGGEEVFADRWAEDVIETAELAEQPRMVKWGELSREQLLSHKVEPKCCVNPFVLGNALTTGYIQRESFESTTSHTLIRTPDHFTEAERAGKMIIDDHPEEHALCYLVRGRGLVVISACGHIGIINTVKTALAVSGVDKLHAVIGGFHLAASNQEYINHTVDAFMELNPDVVLPMHCSGPQFIKTMRSRMPEKLISANLGSRYTFGV